jgi:hypothetical protein
MRTTPSWRGPGRTRGGREGARAEMADSLAKVGIHGAYEGALKYVGNPELISRTHFARFLVETRHCGDTGEVFRRFLTERQARLRAAPLGPAWATRCAGSPGAGGVAVIAHPARYRFTPTRSTRCSPSSGPRRPGRGGGHRQPQRRRARQVRRHGAASSAWRPRAAATSTTRAARPRAAPTWALLAERFTTRRSHGLPQPVHPMPGGFGWPGPSGARAARAALDLARHTPVFRCCAACCC